MMTPATLEELRVAATVLLAAFAMSHLLALVYVWTHRGLSYSQSYIQTLVMSSVVTALMMLAIGNNIVWGVGMVGAMALVRFRTNLRDPHDMVFIFAALVSGISAGTRAYALGAMGTAAFALVALYLANIPFGARKSFDGLLRFTMPWDGAAGAVWMARFDSGVVDAPAHVVPQEFRIAAVETGRIEEMLAVPGRFVLAGAPLARLDTAVLEREIAVAEARLRQLRDETTASAVVLDAGGLCRRARGDGAPGVGNCPPEAVGLRRPGAAGTDGRAATPSADAYGDRGAVAGAD